MLPYAPRPILGDRIGAPLLVLIMIVAVATRLLAAAILQQPIESDALAYFTMAQGLAEQGELADQYGQRAFYSAGYPLLLAPFFAVFGSSMATALAVNITLGAIGVWLIHRLAVKLSGSQDAALLAAGVFALWFPGIWTATTLAKENLSTPLVLALALCALHIARDERPKSHAMLGGLLWGGALITGGSALPLSLAVAAALIALWRARMRFAPACAAGLCFLLGAAIMLAPWLYATDRMVGRPVLTTNAAFNLYLGNNPAATGRFVSIADTPLGQDWNETRKRLGETANADRLHRVATQWIAEHPGTATRLALRKLAYFWQPNIPDRDDLAASKAIAAIRLIEVVQYLLIVLIGVAAFRSPRIPRDGKWIFAAMIIGFWIVHAAAYIIVRYRDPIMPLLIVTGAVPVSVWLQRFFRQDTRDAT